jgi:hypothetical protein
MAKWQILYADEGEHPERDTYLVKLRFLRDGTYLGIALAEIDGLEIVRHAPREGEHLPRFYRAMAELAAMQLADAISNGEVRTEWSREAHVVTVDLEEARQLAVTGDVPADQLQFNTVLREFDT